MTRRSTFGQKLALGFGIVVALALCSMVVSILGLRSVVASKDRVISVNAQNLIDAEKLVAGIEREAAATRGYLISSQPEFLSQLHGAAQDVDDAVRQLEPRVNAEGKPVLVRLKDTEDTYGAALEKLIAAREGATPERLSKSFDSQILPLRAAVDDAAKAFIAHEQQTLTNARTEASNQAQRTVEWVIGVSILALILAVAAAVVLSGSLARQIGSAVAQVQSSSAELQAAASQQATAAREQASAMTEISTTISELLATSRQIAESARRVAQIAGQTAGAAQEGDETVGRTRESFEGIRSQVASIVTHVLDLGRKSQQIGGILEIINELAEQTNILAINATIEAAGAGEAGRRFAVVADEIRKLADRVSGSTKEIKSLIEEIRGAVNTSVMVTESGAKTVEAGGRQFQQVTERLERIVELVGTTTEAAREIELSTNQQTTAVEQVNLAIAGAAQATKETETSSNQTLQTASELSGLSRELIHLVRAQGEASA